MSHMGSMPLADGGHLRFDDSGSGPTVVLLHPGLWDRRVWDDQMESLPAAGFRTIRYDQRGYGESSRLTGKPCSPVADLLALLDHLDVTQAAVVGCSVGGEIAIDFTLEHPDRVWALVPVASGPSGFEPLQEEEDWWKEVAEPIEAAIGAGELERAEELSLGIWAPLGTGDEAGAKIRRIAFDNIHEMTMDESSIIQLDPPAAHRLADLDVPTLVLIAEHDPPFSRRAGDFLAREILGAQRVVVEGADHVVNLRQPARFDASVIPFLTAAVPTTPPAE
jgi:2-hydroxy-6-oxonona-2,4-dienedioate hydrolase